MMDEYELSPGIRVRSNLKLLESTIIEALELKHIGKSSYQEYERLKSRLLNNHIYGFEKQLSDALGL